MDSNSLTKKKAINIQFVHFFYFLALKVCWKRKLVSICEDPVSGLMSVMSDYDRLLCDSPVLPYLHRLSVCGLFIRRILLGFEKLSFTEVSNFAAIFKQYCCDGLTILLEYQPEISSQSELSALVEFTQEMNKSIGKILTGQSFSEALILASTNPQYDVINYGFLTTETNSKALYIFRC